MRAMNRTEQYLHDRATAISEANQNPFMYQAAMAAFVREVADATALLVGEGYGDAAVDYFNVHFKATLDEMRNGAPPAVRLTVPSAGEDVARPSNVVRLHQEKNHE